jgi:hypothetical protein
VATGSGSTLDSTSVARGVTEFARPEESSGIIDVTDVVREANWYEEGRSGARVAPAVGFQV